jgi:hypothetical protein
MSSNANLYTKVVLPAVKTTDSIESKMYNGFSSVNTSTENFKLYDIELVKQDILNHFYVRQGERLMQPSFGTIIWDMLFEPLTEQLKSLIVQNVNDILNSEPRIKTTQVIVSTYESGIQIECQLTYLPYNISEALQLRFDQVNGLLTR